MAETIEIDCFLLASRFVEMFDCVLLKEISSSRRAVWFTLRFCYYFRWSRELNIMTMDVCKLLLLAAFLSPM